MLLVAGEMFAGYLEVLKSLADIDPLDGRLSPQLVHNQHLLLETRHLGGGHRAVVWSDFSQNITLPLGTYYVTEICLVLQKSAF